MIRAHSGVPGTGKTSKIVDDIEHNKEFDGRTVYSHAVDGWDRAIKMRCLHPACRVCRLLSEEEKKEQKTVETWFEWVCPGDLLVIDEAHYPFPSRREKEQPLFIQRLTEHRHDGIDIWLATPNINFLDINVRRLVQQHVHFAVRPTGRFTYTHSEVMESDDKLRFGIEQRFFLPKRSFGLYKSADAHVKLKSPMPWKFYAVVALPVIGLGLMYWTYGNMKVFAADGGLDVPEEVLVEPPVEVVPNVFGFGGVTPSGSQQEFQGVVVLGCVLKDDDCTCYDSEAEHVAVSLVQCKANAEGDLSPRELKVL